MNNCGTATFFQVQGGSFSGNSFYGSLNTPTNFNACSYMTISNNSFLNCGTSTSGAVSCLVLQDYSSTACLGNTLVGNHTFDDRGTKYCKNCVRLLNAADYNIAIGNSAKGAASTATGYSNGGTGANNSAANNIDA
jgi:hypothetical protein